MLVLSRRVGERLMIGDDVVVTILEVRSDGVRLGIDAPRSIAVNRAEVLEAVKEANVAATAATDEHVDPLVGVPGHGRGALARLVVGMGVHVHEAELVGHGSPSGTSSNPCTSANNRHAPGVP